ncbi:MAG: murein peptide amidase A [Bdellovibrio sp.]|nr:murein peptide amidase A [Bdellovibrio sp.]
MLRLVCTLWTVVILGYSLSFGQDATLAKIAVMDTYCDKMDQSFKKYGWGESGCRSYNWNHVRNSVLGDPLPWVVFGEESNVETTIILCGIHGDEITPVKFCFDIMANLKANQQLYHNRTVLVAPLVNPDSFFKKRPTRTNAHKVDINRNFPTKDWPSKAIKYWTNRCGKDPRRYPGYKPLSEPEVLFQVNLLIRYSPNKIISVHAPLTMLDYDGPKPLQLNEGIVNNGPHELLIQMGQKANGYRIVNFPVYPGSLGNYAGNERNIPTYTLELPSSNPAKSGEYWQLFRSAIDEAILKDLSKKLRQGVAMDAPAEENKSNSDQQKVITR